MGDVAHHEASHGQMDIAQHRATFSGFIKATEWGSALIIASVALLTVALAMGLGWFAGLLAFAAVGIVAGVLLRLGAAWWALVAVSLVVLGIGGGVVALVMPAHKAALLSLAAFA